ncbi:5-hydroxytryptamine receptor 3A [Cottoperca gobio]|uniref:5-hydroxytryptamine receptor 3A n=1 Tax=Cottoperca gobio TaxID=56716 RepID=A0A6J2Q2W1_COTGO|nr:5-hydroxytryptamine receptor 3A-like [Cottoperca gobio]
MSALRTLAFLALIAGVSSSKTSDCSYVSLLTHLNLTETNDVLEIMRPVKNWTTPTLVQVDMVLFGILKVDEKSQTVTSHIGLQMRWTNEFLTWNPSDFCGINVLSIPRSRLWIPDVEIIEDSSDTGSISRSPVVSLSPNGLVKANARQRLTSTCLLNVSMFPFDTQNCEITFSSMNSDAYTIQLGTVHSEALLNNISELSMVTKGEWELENMDIKYVNGIKVGGSQSKLLYTIRISRKPMLYVINLIVPLFYFLVLDLGSFFISEARGEKLSFKVTILLSISVLLLILKDILPSTEDNLPLIATYCVTIFAMVGLSVLEAMLVSYLYDLDGCCCNTAQSPVDEVDIQLEVDFHKEPPAAEETPEKSSRPLDRPSDGDLLKLILQEVKAAQQEVKRQDKDQREPGRYRRLANIIDRVFFTVYFLTITIFMTCMNTFWLTEQTN